MVPCATELGTYALECLCPRLFLHSFDHLKMHMHAIYIKRPTGSASPFVIINTLWKQLVIGNHIYSVLLSAWQINRLCVDFTQMWKIDVEHITAKILCFSAFLSGRCVPCSYSMYLLDIWSSGTQCEWSNLSLCKNVSSIKMRIYFTQILVYLLEIFGSHTCDEHIGQ